MAVTKIGCFIGGTAVEFAMPFEVRLIRGVDPWRFSFITSDPGQWTSKNNPVDIRIQAPNAAGTFPQTKVLNNWYITSVEPWEGGTHVVTIQDKRWFANRLTFTGNFNIKMVDGTFRTDSLFAGSVEWRALDAIKKVLQEFGFNVVIERALSRRLRKTLLPQNLGNSQGGGWVAAQMAEILPRLLETIRCDMTMRPDGQVEITDRITDFTKGMRDFDVYEGSVKSPERKWQKPKNIVVQFEQRMERILEYNEDPQASAVFGPHTFDQLIENVVPEFDFAKPRLNPATGLEETWFTEFDEYVQRNFNFDLQEFRKRYERDTIIPDGQFTTDQAQFDARVQSEIARQNYRKTWRIIHSEGQFRQSRPYADMKFGRLGPDGNSSLADYLFMDYTIKHQFSEVLPADILDLGAHKFSKSVPFPNVFKNNDAPYDAKWISDEKVGLVFALQERRMPTKIKRIIPGLLDKNIGYGNVNDIIQGLDNIVFETNAEVTRKFRLRLYYNGLLVIDPGVNVNNVKRVFEVKVPAFSTGLLDVIFVRASGITANWAFIDGTGEFPGELLNADELKKRAEFVADQIKQTYRDAKSGILSYAGLEALVADFVVRGNIYSVAIKISEETVTTHYVVQPEVRQITGEPEQLDGIAPWRINRGG